MQATSHARNHLMPALRQCCSFARIRTDYLPVPLLPLLLLPIDGVKIAAIAVAAVDVSQMLSFLAHHRPSSAIGSRAALTPHNKHASCCSGRCLRCRCRCARGWRIGPPRGLVQSMQGRGRFRSETDVTAKEVAVPANEQSCALLWRSELWRSDSDLHNL